MTPVLFLDIDGVLLAGRHWRQESRERLPADTMALLNETCYLTGSRVVVSSVWREDDGLRARMKAAGFTGDFHDDWRTPQLHEVIGLAAGKELVAHARRGLEIADWLARNGAPPYAIVDDDSDMLLDQLDRFVKTDFETGLTRPAVERLVAILAGQAVPA